MRSMLLVPCLLVIVSGSLYAQQAAQRQYLIGSIDRHALLNVARTRVLPQLHQRVHFVVKRLWRRGDWALLHATMKGDRGRPISYVGTRYEEADRHGRLSHSYDALLLHTAGGWIVRADRIGAIDAPWTHWSTDYDAPADLFPKTAQP